MEQRGRWWLPVRWLLLSEIWNNYFRLIGTTRTARKWGFPSSKNAKTLPLLDFFVGVEIILLAYSNWSIQNLQNLNLDYYVLLDLKKWKIPDATTLDNSESVWTEHPNRLWQYSLLPSCNQIEKRVALVWSFSSDFRFINSRIYFEFRKTREDQQ